MPTTTTTPAKKPAAKKTPAKKTAAARPTMEVDLAPTDHDVPLLGSPGAGMAHVADLPLADLTPHPDNVRHAVDDLEEIADSIRARGILQRLVVAPTPNDEHEGSGKPIAPTPYVVIAGHRRFAAAALAGLQQVPVEIRYDLASLELQVEAMLVENIHRKDLTAVEEGEAYQTLLDLGTLDEDGIAHATGRSLATVRRRVRLANAPVAVRNAVHAGMATLTDVDKLDDLHDEPDLLDLVVPHLGTPDYAWRLQDALRTKRSRDDSRAQDAQMRATGITILADADLPDGWTPYYGVRPTPVDRVHGLSYAPDPAKARDDHATDCPHAVWIWPKAVHACWKPDTHNPTITGASTPATAGGTTTDDQDVDGQTEQLDAAALQQAAEARAAEDSAWREIATAHVEVRNTYVRDLLTQGINPGHTDYVTRALAAFNATSFVELDQEGMAGVCRALGAVEALVDHVAEDWDDLTALTAWTVLAAKPAAAALAVLWRVSPDCAEYGWHVRQRFTEEQVAWLRLLEDLGLQLSTWEQEHLVEAEAAHEALAKTRTTRWAAELAEHTEASS